MSRLFVLSIVCCFAFRCFAQEDKTSARYEIDAKRIGVDFSDKDALPRSREFLRIDSTYYVGWMYEGMYKYNRSADYLGYKNAIAPLRKSLDLLEKDYDPVLRNIYSSISYFSQHVQRYQDMIVITNALNKCYDNIEMPDSVMAVLDEIESYHFQRDYFGIYFQRAWEYHRNRFFTSDKFSFLKNSIAANEQAAFASCYKGFAQIEENKAVNDAWFGAGQSNQSRLQIYHYLALLHSYNKNYDSSEYYYQQLAENGAISWNNYGNLQGEVGRFANAIEYYSKDMYFGEPGMLQEPFYYLPQLYVYGGDTKKAISMCNDIIKQTGSKPGFGWYNIGLARSYMYDGQLDSAQFALNKAAGFKELHIGTTLSQTQYDFTISLLKAQLLDRQIAQIKFLNKGWWYSLTALFKIASLKVQRLMADYVAVNELANNPDRSRLVYDLFCGESTTTYDEAWYLLKNFSPKYFRNKYEDYQRTDNRQNIQRYFKLFAAQFKEENGDEDEALNDYENIVKTTLLDTANEKLFLGRLYEDLSRGYKGYRNEKDNYNLYRNTLLEVYPQLAPFSNVAMPVQLHVTGITDDATNKVINDVKHCNIDFDTPNNAANANIEFIKKGDKYEAIITVKSAYGKTIVADQKLVFKDTDGVGGELALRLFAKGGALVYEKPADKS